MDISSDTLEDIHEVISVYDREGDGKIDIENIIDALRALGCNPGKDDWKEELKGYKEEGMFRIDEQEFTCIYKAETKKPHPTVKELCDGLKGVDTMQSETGTIDMVLLKRYMTNLGDTVTEEQAEFLLKDCIVKSGNLIDITKLIEKVSTPVV